jgi:hypothetical protein
VTVVLLTVALFIGGLLIFGNSNRTSDLLPNRPPYQLSVVFRPGTTAAQATSALRPCSKNSEVTGIGYPSPLGGIFEVIVYTRDEGHTTGSADLFSCLNGLPSIQNFGYGA